MKKEKFTVVIGAPKEKVWNVLWNDDTYRKWTTVFSEGSKAVTDWKEGSKIHFLDANNDGMNSLIDKCIENEVMNFKHIGVVKNGVEQPLDEATKNWSGSSENYALSETDGITTLSVEMDIIPEYLDYFNKTFPLALDLVKKLAEE
ncbi:Activator of Hsp90 ATPase 1 family protein [Flavobacterium enshiense DK69]|uniref:ATPase n=1 Tax=Flavobacterium enshiense DK69 TaxID=1107311 RepID=V6S7B6_9FLAO|nr:SRPBCC domain-containing protein [Flavobacterium enshiense]ESU22294.1 Activator of Hsp90 ATPase 1 family protein [Flavobacterium enshiense DK69]KGO97302.1 ATPase [Flavobacterium enshiense DK69]